MARLILDPNFSLKDLGKEVLMAAKGKHLGDQAVMNAAQAKIESMFPGLENPNLNFAYDTPETVNVVIPDIGDKVVRDQEFLTDFDFDHLAAETMGFIVIFGCGK